MGLRSYKKGTADSSTSNEMLAKTKLLDNRIIA